MSQSRRRRANAQRHGNRTRDQPGSDGAEVEHAVAVLRALVRSERWRYDYAELAGSFATIRPHVQRTAVTRVVIDVIESVFDRGWTPLDLSESLRRRTNEQAVRWTMSLVAARTASYPPDRVHPQWQAQLAGVDAAPNPGPEIGLAVALLSRLSHLPSMVPVLPRPGAEWTSTTPVVDTDDKVLRRIRALLAKAESTEFDAEAEALSAKAQELMTRYSIDQLSPSETSAATAPCVQRIWIDNPYTVPKSMLVGQVARANRCRTVIHSRDGFVTVMGFESDLQLVELLVTSLLVQATRAMHEAGSRVGYYGESRTKSFRRSFLIAYGRRIGERLRDSAAEITAEVDEGRGGALVPVLAAREVAVDKAIEVAFPDLGTLRTSVGNRDGYGAGRAAADHARLDVRRSVQGHARSA